MWNADRLKLFAVTLPGVAVFACAGLFISGCGHNNAGNITSASEIAESALSGILNSTEPGGTQAVYLDHPAKNYFAQLEAWFSFLPESFASTACPTVTSATCTSGTELMTYSSCGFGASATVWNGSQTLVFSGGCPSTVSSISTYGGNLATRTFASGTIETTSAGVVTTLDTSTASTSGWDPSITVQNGESVAYSGTAGNRVVALGIHLHGVDSGGTALFDHTVSASGLNATGTGTSRSVSGVIKVQNNISKYTATVNITTALTYGTANCCHPSSGVLTAQLTGGYTGFETLTFTGGTCGAATLVDAKSETASITLTHCF